MKNTFKKRMTEQQLRMWCIEQTIHNGFPSYSTADAIYKYVTEEREESQKKPREHFFSRLWLWLRGCLK